MLVNNTNQLLCSRLKKFFSYYQPYRGLLVADLLCAFILSATTLLLPLCARYVTQHVLVESASDALRGILTMGAIMLGLVAIQTVCNLFVDYQGHMMGTLMESDMRRDLFAHYQSLSFSFYDNQQTGQLMSRITGDLVSLSEFYHHGPEDLAIAVLKFIGAFVIMMFINIPMTLIIFVFLPPMMVYAFYFNQKMNAALGESRRRIGDVNAQVEDSLAGIRVVQSFTNEAIENEKFARANARFVDSRRDGYKSEGYFYGGMMVFTQLFTISVIVVGGIGIVQGSLDLPDLLTFLLYVGSLTEPIQRAVNFARLYQEGVTGFSRFMEIMEIEPPIRDSHNAIDLPFVQGNIEFRDVSFRYHKDHTHLIKNVSLEIKVGEYVALVGMSGVGKTTLCSLIPRFYDVDDGEILLDGINIRDIRLACLRQKVGIVQQDVYLFAGTVADNIQYGKPDASRQSIIEVAKKANAHEFIIALPNGYDTYIGQRGVKLSGGQKQRVSIARTFLKDPPIVIFDEATSALDNDSERAIRQSLEMLTRNRTTLVIAHRLSTIRNAQRIIVLTDTGIQEQGTHETLLGLGGVYANLYQMELPQ